ncbi:hypothetical protein CRG98_007743 [Punica granatum]|uniref:Uncharacterized protein n=1 Tax=Punica granatum TaxID=22663 RepID=A0A2I0KTS6_PUNGR|nr:hypothetical protein CRG98_007743 [Punica granatum]
MKEWDGELGWGLPSQQHPPRARSPVTLGAYSSRENEQRMGELGTQISKWWYEEGMGIARWIRRICPPSDWIKIKTGPHWGIPEQQGWEGYYVMKMDSG